MFRRSSRQPLRRRRRDAGRLAVLNQASFLSSERSCRLLSVSGTIQDLGTWGWVHRQRLFQGRILFAGRDQDGNIGIGVLPHRKEILIGFFSRASVARKRLRASQAQIGKRLLQSPVPALMFQDFPELGCSFRAFARTQPGQAAPVEQIRGIRVGGADSLPPVHRRAALPQHPRIAP